MKAILRDYRSIAEAEGFCFVGWKQNGHFKLTLISPNGCPVKITAAVSPSDHRSLRNYRRDLLRVKKSIQPKEHTL